MSAVVVVVKMHFEDKADILVLFKYALIVTMHNVGEFQTYAKHMCIMGNT